MSTVIRTTIIPVDSFFALKYLQYVKHPTCVSDLGRMHQAILQAGFTHVVANYELDSSLQALRKGSQIVLAGLYCSANPELNQQQQQTVHTILHFMQSKPT